MDKQKLEEVRQLAMSMTSHPVAFGTIEHTERAGELLGLLWQEVLRPQCDLKDEQADVKRLRAENARLAREAHTWWTAGRDATGEIERLREVAARMVAGIDHLDKLAREWEPDHSSGADRRGWLLAKDARDDAARLLGPNVRANLTKGAADEA